MEATDDADDLWFTQKDAGKQRGREEKSRKAEEKKITPGEEERKGVTCPSRALSLNGKNSILVPMFLRLQPFLYIYIYLYNNSQPQQNNLHTFN